MPRCSAIIVTYNSATAIETCLRSLSSQDCELIVVDNASQDDTVERVRDVAQSFALQLITNSRNLGFAGGVNEGVRKATGDVLLLLNPDSVAESGAVGAILRCFTTGGSAVGGALIGDDGQPEKGFVFRRLPTFVSLIFEALLINQLWPGNPVNRRYRCLDADYAREHRVEQPAGACLAVKREVWDSLRGMDADFYPVWFEDVDFCARLLASGRKIAYCPAARFHHQGAHSVGQLKFADKQMFWYQNMVRYARKHLGALSVGFLRLSILVGMGVRMLAVLLGAGPSGVGISNASHAYARVALWAIGWANEPHREGTK